MVTFDADQKTGTLAKRHRLGGVERAILGGAAVRIQRDAKADFTFEECLGLDDILGQHTGLVLRHASIAEPASSHRFDLPAQPQHGRVW